MLLEFLKDLTYQEAQSKQVLNRLSKALVAQHEFHDGDVAAGLEDSPPKWGKAEVAILHKFMPWSDSHIRTAHISSMFRSVSCFSASSVLCWPSSGRTTSPVGRLLWR